MSDIVERLDAVLVLRGDTFSSEEVLGMLAAAKAEIERLKAALQQIADIPDHWSEHCRRIARTALKDGEGR